jgi:hypothetical protein
VPVDKDMVYGVEVKKLKVVASVLVLEVVFGLKH